jgi:bifunctional DNase/RNase
VSSYYSDAQLQLGKGVITGDVPMVDLELVVFDYREHAGHIHLRESERGRILVIALGYVEISNLYNYINGTEFRRPATHATMLSLISSLGGSLHDVVVDHVNHKERFFLAKLRIVQETRMVLVDVRPSDAITLAIWAGVPIRVNAELFDVMKDHEWWSAD